jgi:predicted membrane protein
MRDKSFREQRKAYRKERRKEFSRRRNRSGSVLAGLLLLCIGTVLLLKQFGVPFPDWFFTWPMIVIGFGLMIGAGHAFRDPGWVVITGVGTVFLLDKIWPAVPIHHFIWPVLIIVLGFMIILAPRRHRRWHNRDDWKNDERWKKYQEMREGQDWEKWPHTVQTPITENPVTEPQATVITPTADTDGKRADNWLEVVTIFGNVKKLVYSKNFKGGDVVSIFGGAEINLTHADFNGNITIELVQIFGGAKLIVPPHWQIRSEMIAVFGGIEDKRPPQNTYDEDKVIILNGTTFFGGIEIRSY